MTSPCSRPTPASAASSPARSVAAIESLETLPLGPGSQATGKASSAVLACDQLSATTATAPANFTTCRTPLRFAIAPSSAVASLPLNTGHCASAA